MALNAKGFALAKPGCSNRTVRRVREWAEAGLAEHQRMELLGQYGRIIGLALDGVAAAVVATRWIGQRARLRYRWPGRPTTRQLK